MLIIPWVAIMQLSYTIEDEPTEYIPGYGQSYPCMIKVDPDIISRIWDHQIQLGRNVSDRVVDIIEKYGMVHLDKEFMEQDDRTESLNQELVKFHLYHWLYDCVASLDAVACLLNSKLGVLENPRHVAMNSSFIEKLKKKNLSIGTLLSEEFLWMKELKEMRDCIIHREGRLVVGGGTEPCVVIDFNRAFVKGIPLHRKRIQETTEKYTKKLDAFVERILSIVVKW